MYEKIRNELISALVFKYDAEQVRCMISCLDSIMNRYDVIEKQTAVVPYRNDLEEAVKMFLACKKAGGMTDSSVRNMGYTLINFCKAFNKPMKDITSNEIRGYLYTYGEKHHLKNSSLSAIRNTIDAFFQWAVTDEYIEKNPAAKVEHVKKEKPHRRPLTEEEMEYMRRACSTEREKALLEVLYSTGARIHEIACLDKKDIDWDKNKITVFGKNSEYYTVYLNVKAKVALKSYLKSRTDSDAGLFVKERAPHCKVTAEALRISLEEIGKRAGIDTVTSPHVMRHTMATTALRNGARLETVQRMLNHKSPSTTQIYAEMCMDEVEMAHRRAVI